MRNKKSQEEHHKEVALESTVKEILTMRRFNVSTHICFCEVIFEKYKYRNKELKKSFDEAATHI